MDTLGPLLAQGLLNGIATESPYGVIDADLRQ